MRERIARVTAAMTVLLLAGLAFAFACTQNPRGAMSADDGASAVQAGAVPDTRPGTTGAAGATVSPEAVSQAGGGVGAGAGGGVAADSAKGRAVFLAQGCTRCHSVAGSGSPRLPLDGVGARRSTAELRAWTTGAEALADSLPPSTLRTKRAFGRLPAADLGALVAYLASLKTTR